MRIAGSKQVYEKLAPDLCCGLESFRTARNPESDLDAFHDLFALLLSKGYERGTAMDLAQSMVEGTTPAAQANKRFAGVFGPITEAPQP